MSAPLLSGCLNGIGVTKVCRSGTRAHYWPETGLVCYGSVSCCFWCAYTKKVRGRGRREREEERERRGRRERDEGRERRGRRLTSEEGG